MRCGDDAERQRLDRPWAGIGSFRSNLGVGENCWKLYPSSMTASRDQCRSGNVLIGTPGVIIGRAMRGFLT